MKTDKALKKLMNGLLLDCQTATRYVTRDLEGELPAIKRLRMQIHLKVCPSCFRFYRQSVEIQKYLRAPWTQSYQTGLSEQARRRLKKIIEEHQNE